MRFSRKFCLLVISIVSIQDGKLWIHPGFMNMNYNKVTRFKCKVLRHWCIYVMRFCSLLNRVKNEKPKTERDLQEENGDAGVHSIDWGKHYDMKKQEWAYDIISRIADGKSIADGQRC